MLHRTVGFKCCEKQQEYWIGITSQQPKAGKGTAGSMPLSQIRFMVKCSSVWFAICRTYHCALHCGPVGGQSGGLQVFLPVLAVESAEVSRHTCRREEFCCVPANLQWSLQLSHDTPDRENNSVLSLQGPAVDSAAATRHTCRREEFSSVPAKPCSGVCSCFPTRHTCRREGFCSVPANLQWSLQLSHDTPAGERSSVLSLQEPAVESAAISRHTCRRK